MIVSLPSLPIFRGLEGIEIPDIHTNMFLPMKNLSHMYVFHLAKIFPYFFTFLQKYANFETGTQYSVY